MSNQDNSVHARLQSQIEQQQVSIRNTMTPEAKIADEQWSKFFLACKTQFSDDQLIEDYSRRFAYGTDASFYRLTPKLVVKIQSERDLIQLLDLAHRFTVPLTFRAAGTSLSGQAVTDSVLVILAGPGIWDHIHISEDGNTISLQPGVIGADANRALAKWQRKIGPDPASINACKVGGIVANNASGMCCGTAQNSYHTLAGARIVLVDGSVLDTRDVASVTQFRQSHGKLLNRLEKMGEDTRKNASLRNKIEHKYRLKNTTGYSLNALVDFEDPVDILSHLMVGSEGTLGFLSEVTYHTVPDYPIRATALVFFDNIDDCCRAVTALKTTPVSAVELMDGRALQAVAEKPGMPMAAEEIRQLGHHAAALLIETRADHQDTLQSNIETVLGELRAFNTIQVPVFTESREQIDALWGIRKGLFPAVGAVRQTGTTVIIEDVAFPIERLADGVKDLEDLFAQYHYDEALIFGHALEGNLHFVFTQSFDTEAERQRYSDFMDAVCQLVAVEYQGSLKAEHGTGRNVAPYVELEWGQDAYQLMWQIKNLFDPQGILNPGVILNEDPDVHLKNLKPMPAAHELVDKCIECGFCEAVCPSRDLSLTPRQRITLLREIEKQKRQDQTDVDIPKLEKDFTYMGLDTCAATGLCEDRCPVGINTGELVKVMRQQKNAKYQGSANLIARHFDGVTQLVRGGLTVANSVHSVVGTKAMTAVTKGMHQLSGQRIPLWSDASPRAASPRSLKKVMSQVHVGHGHSEKILYWPSCASRNFNPPKGDKSEPLSHLIVKLLQRAGYDLEVVTDNQLCCGQPFESKGHRQTAKDQLHQVQERLWQLSQEGEGIVLSDTSPCTLRLKTSDRLTVVDPFEFALTHLGERLDFNPIIETVALHITCSTRKMGLAETAGTLARQCAQEVIEPLGIDCCGFAGDKGFTVPELNAKALSTLKDQVQACDRGFSTSLTCEIGLTHHAGIPYRSILYLVDEATR